MKTSNKKLIAVLIALSTGCGLAPDAGSDTSAEFTSKVSDPLAQEASATSVEVVSAPTSPEQEVAATPAQEEVASAPVEEAVVEEAPAEEAPTPAAPVFASPSTVYAAHATAYYNGGEVPLWASSFVIAETSAVYVVVDMPADLTGHHQANIEFRMPNGRAYQMNGFTFATDDVASSDEVQAEKTDSGWRVGSFMYVSGTTVQTSNLAGNWAARIYVDGVKVLTPTFSLVTESAPDALAGL